MIIALLTIAAIGAAWLSQTPRHSFSELFAATLTVAPMFALTLTVLGAPL
jgi:hypothetical protein